MGPDTEITLKHGDLELVASPYGASLRGFSRRTADGEVQPIVTGYSGAANKVGGQGDVLIPFPGRIGGGHYRFAGREYQMPRNDHEGPNAIHGFLRTVLWEVEAQSDDVVRFGTSLRAEEYSAKGYPFSLHAQVEYRVEEAGTVCACEIRNVGDGPAPVGAGFHPYFTAGPDFINGCLLQIPMSSRLEFDANLIPTGRVVPVAGTPYDFRQSRPIGEVALNTCYLGSIRDADGLLRVRLGDPSTGRTVTVWMDAGLDYVVVYSGDPLPEAHRRRSLAIEPMTCASDAFNHPEWGLRVLAPGETLMAQWGASTEKDEG